MHAEQQTCEKMRGLVTKKPQSNAVGIYPKAAASPASGIRDNYLRGTAADFLPVILFTNRPR